MEAEKLTLLKSAILGGQVPQMVLQMISYALDLRSSDIHIEPGETTIRVRYRIDGVLRIIVEYPPNMHPAVVSRIKIMSNLKIDEQRIPQDGRSQVTTKDGREMDLRISTFPTVTGEKVVMRIQDKSREIPTLEQLGIRGNSLKYLLSGLEDPNGIILTSGPTGSGKTTTLYACLNILNKSDVNILTIEDPVEIQMPGLNQSQVHHDIDYSFATGLRSALRQDPDIMMVGEIRDRETVDVAIESALTGHLVLSTIHTNSAIETLTRIKNMGVPTYLMASTLNNIIAQRLVRKLCPHCRVPVPIAELAKQKPDMVESALLSYANVADSEKANYPNLPAQLTTVYMPQGCDKCDNSGYFGRLGLYEVIDVNNILREAIMSDVSSLELEQLAVSQGMVTLEQAGIISVALGETSLPEVYRVARRSAGETKKKPLTANVIQPQPVAQPQPVIPTAMPATPVSSPSIAQPIQPQTSTIQPNINTAPPQQ